MSIYPPIPPELVWIEQAIVHWTATGYDWCQPGHYHKVVTADPKTGLATLHELTPVSQRLYDATFGRNHNTVSFACACMDPAGGTWSHPPLPSQIDLIAKELAYLAKKLQWDPKHLDQVILTHAEAAALRDYPLEKVKPFSGHSPSGDWDHKAVEAGLPHANYGPSSWPDGWPGGDVVRWDLYKLRENAPDGSGGHEIRLQTATWMKRLA
jgi:hypothetical protein